jgi:hypothetical protein
MGAQEQESSGYRPSYRTAEFVGRAPGWLLEIGRMIVGPRLIQPVSGQALFSSQRNHYPLFRSLNMDVKPCQVLIYGIA